MTFGRSFLPGPVDVHPEVTRALGRPIFSHRGPEMAVLLQRIQPRLQALFRTRRPVYVGTHSATGFMEAAIRSGVREHVLVVESGYFGKRFAAVAARCGKTVTTVPIPAGQVISPEQLAQGIAQSGADAVAVVHSETSTGALAPLAELARAVRAVPDVLILVDAVTSIGGSPVETDAWGLDFVFTGSQKALALPPGIALAVASERMLARARTLAVTGWYLDLSLHEEAVRNNQPTQTPAVPMFFALDAQLERIEAEGGVEARWERHCAMQRRVEAWVDKHPALRFLSPEGFRSLTVSAIAMPPRQSAKAMVNTMKQRGWILGTGLDGDADLLIRIGHMGDLQVEHLEALLDELSHLVPAQ